MYATLNAKSRPFPAKPLVSVLIGKERFCSRERRRIAY